MFHDVCPIYLYSLSMISPSGKIRNSALLTIITEFRQVIIFLHICSSTFMHIIHPPRNKKTDYNSPRRSNNVYQNMKTAGIVKALPIKKKAPGSTFIVAE